MLAIGWGMWYNGATDAVVAQLAEQLIRNEQVAGSIPVNGSIFLWFLVNVEVANFSWIKDGIGYIAEAKIIIFKFGIWRILICWR